MVATTNSPGSGAADSRRVVLGRVAGPFGVRGWVRVFAYTEPREGIVNYRDCLLKQDDNWHDIRIAEGRKHGKSVVLRFEGCEDRDAAASYAGAEIAVPREALPEAGEGHYYWADLEGLNVLHRDGSVLGKVDYILATGVHDVLVVKGEFERLIPFVPGQTVVEVNFAEGVINVDWEWD